jgi:mycofactocin glycosyltransferase
MNPVSPGLPDGFEVQIKKKVIRAEQGRTLVGGSPIRVLRLSPRALALVNDGRVTVADEPSRLLADRLLDANLADPVLPDPTTGPSELTVVVPVRDRAEQLERLLAMLRPALTCVVVDDASREPARIAELARSHGAELVVLHHNVGPAGARNAGLRLVATPFVAFVDSDVCVDPSALRRLCDHFTDPQVVAVAPRIRGVARSTRPRWFHRYDEVASSLDLSDKPSLVRPGSSVSWLPSACLVARVERLGCGFDEELRVGEDVDLVWRLIADGGRVRYEPALEALHDSRDSLFSWLARKAFYGTGAAPLAARHGDLVAPAIVSPTYAVVAVALVAQRSWSVPVGIGGTVLTARRLAGVLPMPHGRTLLAGRLAGTGLGATVHQTSQLLLRHWWPATAVAAVFSGRIRRAIVVAAVVDAVMTPRPPSVSPATFLLARRLDDLAYGAGLWLGAVRGRSARALLPRFVRRTG